MNTFRFTLSLCCLLLGFAGVQAQQTITITNQGLEYTPDTVTVQYTDSVRFNVGNQHPTLQVSRTAYLNNNAQPATNGFNFPTGNGIIAVRDFAQAGLDDTLFFVCTNHVNQNMKGLIAVQPVFDSVEVLLFHNAPDPAVDTVDIYVETADGNPVDTFQDVAFRNGLRYVSDPVPALTQLDLVVKVAPDTSTQSSSAFYEQGLQLDAGEKYVVIANGVVNPNQGVGLALRDTFRFLTHTLGSQGPSSAEAGLIVHHGAPDVFPVDVLVHNTASALANDLSPRAFTDFVNVAAATYPLSLTNSARAQALRYYEADLSNSAGDTVLVVASGFLSPGNVRSFGSNALELVAFFPATGQSQVLANLGLGPVNLDLIHNAPDPAVSGVDIFLETRDGFALDTLQNVSFRDGIRYQTPSLPVNYPTSLEISVRDPLNGNEQFRSPLDVQGGNAYAAMVNGVVNPASFSGLSAADTLQLNTQAWNTQALGNQQVGLAFHHGAPDAPAVQIDVDRSGNRETVANSLDYGQYGTQIARPADFYTVEVKVSSNGTPIETYSANLSNRSGDSVLIFASGFNQAANQNAMGSNAFGMFRYIAGDGPSLALPVARTHTAELQIIHASADPSLNSLDVYAGDTLLADDLAFADATEALSLSFLTDQPLELSFAGGASNGVGEAFAQTNLQLDDASENRLVARGVRNPQAFSTAVNDTATIRFEAQLIESLPFTTNANGGVAFYHGVTDAPALRTVLRNVDTLDAAAYGGFTGIQTAPADGYAWDVYDSSGQALINAYDSSAIRSGEIGLILAIGFLDSTSNQSGSSLQFIEVFPNGEVVNLNRIPEDLPLQWVHNIPDPAADSVDLYWNDTKIADDLSFREATAYQSLPATGLRRLKIALATSTGPRDGIVDSLRLSALLPGIGARVGVLQGVVDTTQFLRNPNNISTALTAVLVRNSRSVGRLPQSDFVSLSVVHGAPDAPALNFDFSGSIQGGIDSLLYNGSLWIRPSAQQLVLPADDFSAALETTANEEALGRIDVPLSNYGGELLTLIASGFENASNNNQGPERQLVFLAVRTSGAVDTLSLSNGSGADPAAEGRWSLYPNPLDQNTLWLQSQGASGMAPEAIVVTDMSGQLLVRTLVSTSERRDGRIAVSLPELAPGTYLIHLKAADTHFVRRLVVRR